MSPGYKGREKRRWHMGREVPVTVLVMLAIQTGGFIWWLATLSAKVEEGVKTSARLETQLSAMNQSANLSLLNSSKITALETELDRVRSRLDAVQLEQQRRAPYIPKEPANDRHRE